MALPERLYVDANIFIRLFEGNDALARALGDLFTQRVEQPPFALTSELTLAEVLVLPMREGRSRSIERYDAWLRSSGYLEVVPVDRSILWSAAAIRAEHQSLKLPDAIHLATALRAGCGHFLTADLKLDGSYRIDSEAGAGTVEVVRPDIGYLRSLITELPG